MLVDGKRIVVLTIPAVKEVITEFNKERYIRIGSSKELLRKFPERERKLWQILSKDAWSITEERSYRQDLTLTVFKLYMEKFHIPYNQDNFYANNHFMNSAGELNYIAFLMSDQCDLIYKVVKWKGKAKPDCEFVYKKDFGGGCGSV